MTRRLHGPEDYELTLAGGISPLLRLALQPHSAVKTQTYTIIRVGASRERDLVDLMLNLTACGLEVDGVFRLDTANSEGRPID